MRDVKPPQRPHDPGSPLPSSPAADPDSPRIIPAPRKRTTSAGGRLSGSSVPVASSKTAPKPSTPTFKRRTVSGKPQKKARGLKLAGHERTLLVSILGLVAVVAGLVAIVFLPRAEVTLVLQTSPLLVDQTLTFTAASGGEPAEVPASSYFREITVSDSVPATGLETVGKKATGSVELVNRTVEQQDIKERSRLVTDGGELFYMLTSAKIPSLGRVTVPVEAAEAGEGGNINNTTLNFAALDEASQSLVFAEVVSPIEGGSGDQVAVITEEDLSAARQHSAQKARERVEDGVRGELPADWVLLEESWQAEILSFEPDHEANTQADALSFESRLTVRVLGYEKAVLEQRIEEAVSAKLAQDHMLFPGPINYTVNIESVDWDAATASARARITHTTIPQFSLNTLREKINGRSQAEAHDFLAGLPGVKSAAVDLKPFWVRSVPRVQSSVSIDLVPERQP